MANDPTEEYSPKEVMDAWKILYDDSKAAFGKRLDEFEARLPPARVPGQPPAPAPKDNPTPPKGDPKSDPTGSGKTPPDSGESKRTRKGWWEHAAYTGSEPPADSK